MTQVPNGNYFCDDCDRVIQPQNVFHFINLLQGEKEISYLMKNNIHYKECFSCVSNQMSLHSSYCVDQTTKIITEQICKESAFR